MVSELLAREEGKMLNDENPCPQATMDEIDWKGMESIFLSIDKNMNKRKAKSLGIYTTLSGEDRPSNGGVLLFGTDRGRVFPDAIIRCVRFAGITKEQSLDHAEIDRHLPDAIDDVCAPGMGANYKVKVLNTLDSEEC